MAIQPGSANWTQKGGTPLSSATEPNSKIQDLREDSIGNLPISYWPKDPETTSSALAAHILSKPIC